MITISNGGKSHKVTPTVFPDGTSQCWKLPEWTFDSPVDVTWMFESEREIIDLLSLNFLVEFNDLNIPYLPYARQDKEISNSATFNLKVIAKLLNSLRLNGLVTSYDVHSSGAKDFIIGFNNEVPGEFHVNVINRSNPTYLVFPDAGAALRYKYLANYPHIIFDKERDQATGEILGHKIAFVKHATSPQIQSGDSFLIVDDLADGGATFISIAKELRRHKENIGIDLCVSHGLFSKGKEVLYNAGIQNIYTTNSLLKNKDGYKVC